MRSDLGNKERKDFLSKQKLIHCGRCKYHRGENGPNRRERSNRHKCFDRESIRYKEDTMTYEDIKMKLDGFEFVFDGMKMSLEVGKYFGNDRTAIKILHDEGCPYAMLTVNVPEARLEEDEVFIKNYSENKEIAEYIFSLGLFEYTMDYADLGYAIIPVWRIK